MIFHDEDALEDILEKHEDYLDFMRGPKGLYPTSAKLAMCEYHEHMVKWLPMVRLPEPDQWIEVLCNNLGDIHTITYQPERIKSTDIGWRPSSNPTGTK